MRRVQHHPPPQQIFLHGGRDSYALEPIELGLAYTLALKERASSADARSHVTETSHQGSGLLTWEHSGVVCGGDNAAKLVDLSDRHGDKPCDRVEVEPEDSLARVPARELLVIDSLSTENSGHSETE
ncbi:hypothetical protein PF005_g21843 [Phytophthora fragariae]|uniref:Uncharacterized protein n=1 Tax=Phytophthora fragariae TaxID=53985 RepID=A0A6A3WK99_9STRA|nr:hypothetical protein PF005_g21843 [Phytophthora fragariae]